ncbi:hypothetical protein J4477_00950 [Candidatus Pacearchaeota archaeon]|nr:hypothetical protein [Candidatus Pacearchaeota archaeon]
MTKSRKLTSDEEKIVMELFPEKIGDYTRLHSSFCDEAFETLKETGAKGEDINKMVGDFLHSLTKLYAFREKSGLYLFATPQDEKYNGDYRRTRIFLQRRINGWPYRVSPYEEQFASRFSEGNLPNILCVESPTDKKREKWNHRKLERWDLPYFFDGEFVNKDDVLDPTYFISGGFVIYGTSDKIKQHLKYLKILLKDLDRMLCWSYTVSDFGLPGGMTDTEGHPQNRD